MHRSNFRINKPGIARESPSPGQSQANGQIKTELDAIREQIANVKTAMTPLTANVERLAAPKKDISVPDDIAQALRLAHGRLDRVEQNQKEALSELRRMATTFSNAILKLSDKVEKIAGVEDSSFSLAHSLEKLLSVLETRKLKIIRDSKGDMVAVETEL